MRSETCESIKRDRDYLQQQLDDQRYEAERKSEEEYRKRERARKERQRALNPSNRLYNGEVTDFREATFCHVQACESELSCASLQPTDEDDERERQMLANIDANLRRSIMQAERARQIHEKITEETRSRISQALRDEKLDEWADCFDTNDYSAMAI